MFVDLITSEVKILRPQTSNSTFSYCVPGRFALSFSGCMIPGEQRHNPSLSWLRFVPSNTQILLSRDWVAEISRTVFGALRIAPFQTHAVAFASAFWTFATLAPRLVLRPARIWVGIVSVFVIYKFVIRPPDLFSRRLCIWLEVFGF